MQRLNVSVMAGSTGVCGQEGEQTAGGRRSFQDIRLISEQDRPASRRLHGGCGDFEGK